MADHFLNLWQQGLEPLEERVTTGISDPQPENHRCNAILAEAMRKILILCHKDAFPLNGIFPDPGIIGIQQTDIGDMYRIMAM